MKPVLQTRTALRFVVLQRAGFRRGGQLLEMIDDYGEFLRDHGRDLGFEAYANWTRRYSYRTAYRRLAVFKAAFPEAPTPATLYGPLLEQLASEVMEQ